MITYQQKKAIERVVEALISGTYPQGHFTMKTVEGKYCCLGVAYECLVAPLVGDAAEAKRLAATNEYEYDTVIEKLGLSPKQKYRLVSMNDATKYTFKEI